MAGISVIIPAYNRASLLPQTLRSLLDQALTAEEILVVDDGSTDGTAEVAESIGDPVRVIRQANAGPGAARNTGFRESRGEFIHFFDSDDLAVPNKHEIQLRALETSGADIAYGPWVKGSIGDRGFMPENQVLQQYGLPNEDLMKALLTHWSVVPHACLFRREIVETVGGFPESVRVAEDQWMFLRCLLAGAKVVHSPGTLELYRTNLEGKLSGASPEARARQVAGWASFLVAADRECRDCGRDPREWFGFRTRVWRALRELAAMRSDHSDLAEGLGEILRGREPGFVHAASQWLKTKRGGLQARLAGGRADRSFRIGPVSEEQRRLVGRMGLEWME